MQACVIIPVWNGVASIAECLRALLATDDERVDEIVCVDNASTDGSGALIAAEFPQVRLLAQPVNLGFAGGVNAGAAATQAEMIVLLNQDCLVTPGWLDGFSQALHENPDCGAVGCVVLAADGAVNHAGARISRPLGYGEHLTAILATQPYPVEYATGAFLACRRHIWEQLGGMDEQFYPAYFEESDFCHRMRRQGYRVLVAPDVRATHLFTSREWQSNPAPHHAQQHRSRYRFVCKQFDDAELLTFFAAELSACVDETFFYQAIGRVLASRHLLRSLPEIAVARSEQFADDGGPPFRRIAEVKFGEIYRAALHRTQILAAPGGVSAIESFEQWRQSLAALHLELAQLVEQPDAHVLRNQQLEVLERARCLHRELVALTAPDGSWVSRVLRRLHNLRASLAPLLQLQTQLIAAHELGVSRLDLIEVNANQRLAGLEHRLDLIENQLTQFEYQRRVSDLLAEYEQF